MNDDIRILMCPPDHYDVDYVINPWMEGNIHKSSPDRAVEQWQKLHQVLKDVAIVDLVAPAKGWPDMEFTANGGLVLGTNVVLSVTGTLSSGAAWKWYKNSCGGTCIGTGSTLSVAPTRTPTY
jgi:hypothetical protein